MKLAAIQLAVVGFSCAVVAVNANRGEYTYNDNVGRAGSNPSIAAAYSRNDRLESRPQKRHERILKKPMGNRKNGGGNPEESNGHYPEEETRHSPAPTPSPTTHAPVKQTPSSPLSKKDPKKTTVPTYTTSPHSQPGHSKDPPSPPLPGRKHRASRKRMNKLDKGKGSKREKGKGKGKGSGDEGGGRPQPTNGDGAHPPRPSPATPEDCTLPASEALEKSIPEVVTKFPQRCCNFDGPIALYVTHAQKQPNTGGFEVFWEAMYAQIEATSAADHVCFVMTGYDSNVSSRQLSAIITDTTVMASTLPEVIAMMVTDPTDDTVLVNEIRLISNDPTAPSIGVFNAGYNNIVVESLVSGLERLPFIGFLSDAAFGIEAAIYTLDLLDGVPAKPVCFNGRPDLVFVGERCAAYYAELTPESVTPGMGIACTAESTVGDLLEVLVAAQANAVYAHVDCCRMAAQAAGMARDMGQTILAVGCQDMDTTGDVATIDFVTTQPILLQGYTPATWTNFPVRQSLEGRDGRGRQYFPSLNSLVNTAIFTEVVTA